MHVFRYSPRKGTVGARLPDAVPEQVKKVRSDILEKLASEIAEDFVRSNMNAVHTVLIEEHRENFATGYTDNYIRVYIEDENTQLLPGTFVKVKLTDLYQDGCLAELLC